MIEDPTTIRELVDLANALEQWQDEEFGAAFIDKTLRINRYQMMCDYLRILFAPYQGHGYAELRAICQGQKPCRYWITVADLFHPEKSSGVLKNAYRWAHERQLQGYDIYCGVLPRGRQAGTRKDVYRACMTWVDIDFKVGGQESAFHAIEVVEPEMVVLSGNGIHAYYQLKDVLELTVPNVKAFESSLHKMQQKIQPGSDSTQDISRVLRLPGTFNLKDKKNPRPVLLARVPRSSGAFTNVNGVASGALLD